MVTTVRCAADYPSKTAVLTCPALAAFPARHVSTRHPPLPAGGPSAPPRPTAPAPAAGAGPAAAKAPSFALQLQRRVRHRLLLKTLGITAFMWVFFAAYFHLLRHPVRPVTVMPLTWIDHALPVQPEALLAYLSLWFYVGIPPGLMLSLRDAAIYGLWVGALCLAGLGLFWLFPTTVPAVPLPPELANHPVHALLQGVDAAGNACPSLHVATATFTAFWVRRLLLATGAPRWVHTANWLWVAAIAYSTVAVRQHVALDVAAGALLALPFVAASLRWQPASIRP